MKTSDKIKQRLIEADAKYWASDNIADYMDEGDSEKLIEELVPEFENVLDGLIIDRHNDPNSQGTARRLAKMYIYELMSGRYQPRPTVTSFPNEGSERFEGMLVVRAEITSMCSHHHQTIRGLVHIGYVVDEDGRVIGLSKLNRIVELFARRGAIQEQLTSAIHNAVDTICENNKGVIVTVVATHNCVSCRGVKHNGASMVTTKASGVFMENENLARKEFFDSLKINNGGHNI